MSGVHDLLAKMAAEETAFSETQFVAPCVTGGQVRARVGGIVQTFAPEPADFQGWGVFQASGGKARLQEEADLPLVDAYLKRFPLLRLRLARQLNGMTWLAYPISESDMEQRFGTLRPTVIHLVTEGARFEPITAHQVGGAWWFAEVDRRADPVTTDRLRDAFREVTEPGALAFAGLTPEMRTTYDLVAQADDTFIRLRQERDARAAREQRARAERQYRQDFGYNYWEEAHRDELEAARNQDRPPQQEPRRANRQGNARREQAGREANDEQRLRQALQTGGGALRQFNDRGEYYLVEWTTANGRRHTSAIAKGDLTVISSGICLSGRDRDFDLQSLVGVIDGRGR